MSKPTLILQPGKTYVTNSGEHITLEYHQELDPFYTFKGSNYMYYGENGCIYDKINYYLNPDVRADDISHELVQDTKDENWHDNPCDDCCNDCDECELSDDSEVHLIDVLKFKQKSNGTKRKLTLKDYSDDSVEIIFKTKFGKDKPQVTTGIRLSYEAILMLYDSLEYMLEEQNVEQSSTLNQRTLH